MKLTKKHLIISVPLIIAVVATITLIASGFENEKHIITGIVEATEIDVASKIPGRIDSICVAEGDLVIKGQVLAKLESKEMDAKVEQVKGMMLAAKAKLEMVQNGARSEEKEAVQKLYEQAKAQYDYAAKTYARFQNLFNDNVISTQEFDEMEFKYNAAKAQMDAAKAKYDMVLNGARFEEKEAVEALYHQAENAFNEASAYQSELLIKAPADGEINQIISDPGEIINSGYPVFSLLQQNGNYVVIQLREDQMKNIGKGKIYSGWIPALDNIEKEFEVTYIAAMGDFATWKPTNQKGEFDLKTFEIHLRGTEVIEGLRPGMTVNISF